MPAEIITLQLGNYANHVGAHFWNLQVHNTSHYVTNFNGIVTQQLMQSPLVPG